MEGDEAWASEVATLTMTLFQKQMQINDMKKPALHHEED